MNPEFEVFRISVIRPPQSKKAIDANEVAPSSKREEICRLIGQGKKEDILGELKKNYKEDKKEVQNTSLYMLAEQIREKGGVLSWDHLENALVNILKVSKEDRNKGSYIEESIKEFVRQRSYLQGAMKVHDAWLLSSLSNEDVEFHNKLEIALKIGAALNYIVRMEVFPDKNVINHLLNRKIRIPQDLLYASRMASFKAKYSPPNILEKHETNLRNLQILRDKLPEMLKTDDSLRDIGKAIEALNEEKSSPSSYMGRLKALYERLAVIQEIKRVSIRSLEKVGAKNEVEQKDQEMVIRSQGLIRRTVNKIFGTKTTLKIKANKHFGKAYAKEIEEGINNSHILAKKKAWANGYFKDNLEKATPGAINPLLANINKEICDVRNEIARQTPPKYITCIGKLTEQIAKALPVRPVGYMDLVRTMERFIENDAREIAYIENRAGGETRERIHTTFESNEKLQTVETEEETEQTKDLQTSTRNELQNEAQRTLQSELTMGASVNLNATYNYASGTVTLNTGFNVGYTNSVSESQRNVATYAHQVTERSLSSLRTRNRRLETTRILRTTEERNRHAFENTGESKSDVYLWVEKIVELSLKNFGKRLLLEFIIPEPGANLAYQYSQGTSDMCPEDFTKTATEIDENNYRELAHQYGARNITPPPQELLIVGKGGFKTEESRKSIGDSPSVKIPPGYIPIKLLISASALDKDGVLYICSLRVTFAGKSINYHQDLIPQRYGINYIDALKGMEEIYDLDTDWMHEVDPQTDGLNLTISTLYGHMVDYSFSVVCQRSCRTFTAWQIETHDKISSAYKLALAEYEEKMRSNPIAGIKGSDSETNRKVELREMKRIAISLLMDIPPWKEYDFYPHVTGEPNAVLQVPEMPEMGMISNLRADLDLYEDSLEWNNSVYTLYSYFWGNPARWKEKIKFNIPDSIHRDFLEAGAVRLIVPVAPDHERDILGRLLKNSAKAIWDTFSENDISNLISGATKYEDLTIEDVFSDLLDELPPPIEEDENIWVKSLVKNNPDLTIGEGRLDVKHDDAKVKVSAGSTKIFEQFLDRGLKIWIEAVEYEIDSVDSEGKSFTLDNKYNGTDKQNAKYVIQAQLLGAPWKVRVPTPLVVLSHCKDRINL